MNAALFLCRLRAVCCSSWGMSPAEFDAAAEAELIAAEDVFEAFHLKASEPFGPDLFAFLFRERELDKRRKLAEARHLMVLLRGNPEPVARARILKRLEELNGRS